MDDVEVRRRPLHPPSSLENGLSSDDFSDSRPNEECHDTVSNGAMENAVRSYSKDAFSLNRQWTVLVLYLMGFIVIRHVVLLPEGGGATSV